MSFTCFTKSLSDRISNAGAAKPDKCSATIKYKPILIDRVRTSKNCGQSVLVPGVKNRTGNKVCFRRRMDAQSGSNVDKTITRLPAKRNSIHKKRYFRFPSIFWCGFAK